MGNSQKCQILAIFVIDKIHKIDMEDLSFGILKIPKVKSLDLWEEFSLFKKFFPGG